MDEETSATTPRTSRSLNRTALTPSGARISSPVQVDTSQDYFDTICKQLAKKNKASRIRHLRPSEDTFTLRKLMNIGLQLNREVGLFYDTVGKPRAGNTTYTRLCLYAADERLTLSGSATSQGHTHAASAYISRPPDVNPNRYQFIAHFHPSKDGYVEQLKNDIQKATQQIELVINQEELILYYNNNGCYNITQLNPRGQKVFTGCLQDNCNSAHAITLDTPIDENILARLNRILPPTPAHTAFTNSSSPTLSLFDDHLELVFPPSDDESDKQVAPVNSAPHSPLFRSAPDVHQEETVSHQKTPSPTSPQKNGL